MAYNRPVSLARLLIVTYTCLMASTIKIVIAEDDPLLMRVYQEALTKAGYIVDIFFNGEDAYRAINEMKEKPTLIMSDVMMPKMNGLELLGKLRESAELKKIPFVLITNLAQEKFANEGLANGAIAYLVKGQYTMKELVEKVKEFVNIRTDDKVPNTRIAVRDVSKE